MGYQMNIQTEPPVEKLLYRMPDLTKAVGLSKTEINKRIREGRFPAGVKLSPQVRAWRAEEVKRWVEQFVPSDVP